jgi:hypothetical protein
MTRFSIPFMLPLFHRHENESDFHFHDSNTAPFRESRKKDALQRVGLGRGVAPALVATLFLRRAFAASSRRWSHFWQTPNIWWRWESMVNP